MKRVVCKLGGTSSKTLDMGWCLDFGAIDWTDLSMALREFVANAIDRTVRENGNFLPAFLARTCGSPLSKTRGAGVDGYTRVFVEVNADVQRFYGELPSALPALSSRPSLVKEPCSEGRSKSQRQTDGHDFQGGRIVREITEDEEASVYDYNFHGGELSWTSPGTPANTRSRARRLGLFRKATAQQLVPVFKSLVAQERTYEATFD